MYVPCGSPDHVSAYFTVRTRHGTRESPHSPSSILWLTLGYQCLSRWEGPKLNMDFRPPAPLPRHRWSPGLGQPLDTWSPCLHIPAPYNPHSRRHRNSLFKQNHVTQLLKTPLKAPRNLAPAFLSAPTSDTPPSPNHASLQCPQSLCPEPAGLLGHTGLHDLSSRPQASPLPVEASWSGARTLEPSFPVCKTGTCSPWSLTCRSASLQPLGAWRACGEIQGKKGVRTQAGGALD